MRTHKNIFIALLLILLLSLIFAACVNDDEPVDSDGSAKGDNYDRQYEVDKCYYSWTVVNADESGNSTDKQVTKLSANERYFIAFGFHYGVKTDINFDRPVATADWWKELKPDITKLRFVLVLDDGTVLYDDQAVSIGESNASYSWDGVEVNLSSPLDGRFSIGYCAGTDSMTDVISADVEKQDSIGVSYIDTMWYLRLSRTDMTIEFSPKQNGTLYIDFMVGMGDRENICESAVQEAYVVGDTADGLVSAAVNNLNVGYLTEYKYASGEYIDSDLTSSPSFDSGNAYMVVDFDFNAVADNDGRSSIKVMVGVFGTALEVKIEEVSTGNIFESTENGVAKMYASFKLSPTASESKHIRMIVRLTLTKDASDVLSEFGTDVLFVGEGGMSIAGKSFYSYVFSSVNVNDSPLVFERTDLGYEVVGITDTTVTSLVIPQRYNGYEIVGIKEGLLAECTALESLTIPFVGCYRVNQGINEFGVLFGQKEHWGYTETEYNVPLTLKTVVISEGATKIGAKAFEYCDAITSIVVPSSVTSIGERAFYGCDALQNITLPFIGSTKDGSGDVTFGYIFGSVPSSLKRFVVPNGTTELGKNAFAGCEYLEYIEIPESVTSIGYCAFSGCSRLNSIEIPEKVTSIGAGAFSACSNLTDVEIPSSVTSLERAAFGNCTKLVSVSFGENSRLESIGERAFAGCSSLMSIVLPAGVTEMGERVFEKSGVVRVELSEGLTELPNYTFFECFSLESIVVPSSITSFGANGGFFYRCTALASVTFNGTTEQWLAIQKPNGWNWDAYSVEDYTFKVYCIDGILDVHGNKVTE